MMTFYHMYTTNSLMATKYISRLVTFTLSPNSISSPVHLFYAQPETVDKKFFFK